MSGAQVIRLRTRPGAPVRGHALLIGAPLAGLVGVDRCLTLMQRWLLSKDFVVVDKPVPSEAARIEEQMTALLADVEPGDWVLVYYAGHGMQVLPREHEHPRPLAVMLPIDAIDSEVVVTGEDWNQWLEALSKAVEPDDCRGRVPGVTVILECCHALALMERWPEASEREAIMRRIREDLAALRRQHRGPFDPLPGVVRVLASGRDERADVGEMTAALVGLLDAHPDEPWWALMDRLRGAWSKPGQHPGVTGPIERVPVSHDRLERPAGLVPCRRDEASWRLEIGATTGWTPQRRLALTSSLRLPPRAWATLDADGARLHIVGPAEASAALDDFAWAMPAPHRRRAVVMVSGGSARQRRDLARRLQPLVKLVDEPAHRSENIHGHIRFQLTGRAVEIYDRWGDRVACTSRDDPELWSAWLDRLTTLDDWLDLAKRGSPWPAGALDLRWGTYDRGDTRCFDGPHPAIDPSCPIWVEVIAAPWMRAYVSIFRILADRSVESLSRHAPRGLILTGDYPKAALGTSERPLRFEWPAGEPSATDDEPRTEWIVALVSEQPMSLAMLACDRVQAAPVSPLPIYRTNDPRSPRMTMLVQRYRITRRRQHHDRVDHGQRNQVERLG